MKKILFILILSFSMLELKAQEDRKLIYYFDGDYYNACYIESTQTDNRGETVYVVYDDKGFYTMAKSADLFKPKDLPIDAVIRGEIK